MKWQMVNADATTLIFLHDIKFKSLQSAIKDLFLYY